MLAKPIIYEEIKNYFRLDNDDKLWVLNRGKWRPCHLNAPNGGGYLFVNHDTVAYKQHRVIYCIYHAQDITAELQIDHIDGNRGNNRPTNLRMVTRRENCQNKRIHREGKLCGIQWHSRLNKYEAVIWLKKEGSVSLGVMDNQEEAYIRYQEALSLLPATKEELQRHFGVAQRTSKYKGVHWNSKARKWVAHARTPEKKIHLGYFKDELEAYQAVVAFKDRHSTNKL